MKCHQLVWSAVCSVSLAGSLLLGASPADAGTVAYWRFENGPADAQVSHGAANGVWAPDVGDSSGNGNHLSAWTSEPFAGYAYKTDVPFSTVPQAGAANNYSVKNTGGVPGMWNNTLQSWTPSAWTVEASFKPENGGYRTIVGRDSLGAGTQPGADGSAAAMYFQLRPGNRLAIVFQDVSGYQYTAESAENVVQGFDWGSDPNGLLGKWYSAAAVSDGSTLSLYLNDVASGIGYQLIGQANLTLSGSANTALSAGAGDGGDWDAGNFTVGRGLYGGRHGDRAYGFIDEVRLSDSALSVNEFVASRAIPEPATGTLLLLGGLPLLRRRKSR